MTARHLWQLVQGESREMIANKMEKWSKQTKAKKKNQIFFLLLLLRDLQWCQLSQGSYDCSEGASLNKTAKEGKHGRSYGVRHSRMIFKRKKGCSSFLRALNMYFSYRLRDLKFLESI